MNSQRMPFLRLREALINIRRSSTRKAERTASTWQHKAINIRRSDTRETERTTSKRQQAFTRAETECDSTVAETSGGLTNTEKRELPSIIIVCHDLACVLVLAPSSPLTLHCAVRYLFARTTPAQLLAHDATAVTLYTVRELTDYFRRRRFMQRDNLRALQISNAFISPSSSLKASSAASPLEVGALISVESDAVASFRARTQTSREKKPFHFVGSSQPHRIH